MTDPNLKRIEEEMDNTFLVIMKDENHEKQPCMVKKRYVQSLDN